MPNESVVDRVRGHIGDSHGLAIESMSALSQMAVATKDNFGVVDVYFDCASYEVMVHPDSLTREILFPLELRMIGLGTLPGVERLPAVKNYDEALSFARRILKPLNPDAEYFSKPSPVL